MFQPGRGKEANGSFQRSGENLLPGGVSHSNAALFLPALDPGLVCSPPLWFPDVASRNPSASRRGDLASWKETEKPFETPPEAVGRFFFFPPRLTVPLREGHRGLGSAITRGHLQAFEESLRTDPPRLLAEEESTEACSEGSSKPWSPPAWLHLKISSLLMDGVYWRMTASAPAFPAALASGRSAAEIVRTSPSASLIPKARATWTYGSERGVDLFFPKG